MTPTTAPFRCTTPLDCCMSLVIVCPACDTEIPARRAPMVKVTCPTCATRIEVNMERTDG